MADVRDRIDAEWSVLQDTLGSCSEAQLTAPGPNGEWSIKDHVAHITGWEQYLLEVLSGEPGNTVFGVDQATFQKLDADGLNEHLHARTKERSLADVRELSQRTHERVRAALASLTDADLQRQMPSRSGADSVSLLDKVAANTCDHYAEHRGWIQAHVSAG